MYESLLNHVTFDAQNPEFVKILYRLKLFNLQDFVKAHIQDLQIFNICKRGKKGEAIVTQDDLSKTFKPCQLQGTRDLVV